MTGSFNKQCQALSLFCFQIGVLCSKKNFKKKTVFMAK
jgi:hypothetical protein